jgi:exopolyphosphatase/guanosine-5'-triphosphate,3'-diphosphate pyrophosphatase
MFQRNLAAIDLGSNSCRLTIVNHDGDVLYRTAFATRLGEGLYTRGYLSSGALQRGLSAMKQISVQMRMRHVGRYRAIATASCRMAQNSGSFLLMVQERTGIVLEVIDAYEEARLNLLGAAQHVDPSKTYMILYDLGGGSTEISLAKVHPQFEILYTISIPWGARNATEAFGIRPSSSQGRQELETTIRSFTTEFIKQTAGKYDPSQTVLVAASSTPLRLAAMLDDGQTYNREKYDGKVLQTADIDQVIENILRMSLVELIRSPYIGENRARIFTAACVIFKTIYDDLKFDCLTASLKGAQDGMIEELRKHVKTHPFR